MSIVFDIEVFKSGEEQAKYLVHGYDDVFWTDDVDEVAAVIKENIKEYEEKYE